MVQLESRTGVRTRLTHVVPFFGVKDLPASINFYVDGLGFGISNRWEHAGRLRWCELQCDNVKIMLQEFWTDGHHEGAPEGRLGQGVTICVFCDDAIAVYRSALQRGVKAKTPFVGNGLWVTTFSDPDGYRIDFESPTDAPEGTKYTESISDPE